MDSAPCVHDTGVILKCAVFSLMRSCAQQQKIGKDRLNEVVVHFVNAQIQASIEDKASIRPIYSSVDHRIPGIRLRIGEHPLRRMLGEEEVDLVIVADAGADMGVVGDVVLFLQIVKSDWVI